MNTKFYKFSQFDNYGKKIIVATIIAFVLQQLIVLSGTAGQKFLIENVCFSLENILSFKIWTFFTYAFLHSGIFHILLNMLVFYFLYKNVENTIGGKKFLLLYFFSAFCGAFLNGIIQLIASTSSPLMGASASVLGVLSYFCLMLPNNPIRVLLFFIIPVQIKPINLLKIITLIEFLSFLSMEVSGKSNVASSAHIGGIIGGYILFKYFNYSGSFSFKPKLAKKFKKAKDFKFKVYHSKTSYTKEQLKEKKAQILNKISAQGFSSLTKEEKDILNM